MNTKLETIYNQVPQSTCEANCGKCCGPVFPSRAELRNVQQWCEIHHVEYKDFLHITEQGSCPYLTAEKQCEIYPVRPFLCRILGVSSDLSCPVNKCTPSRLLNHLQSDALYSAIYLHGKEKRRTKQHAQIVREVLASL